MEPARLVPSNKQAATSNQLHRALSGPQGRGGVPKSTKKCYHAIRDGFPQLFREQLFFGRTPRWSQGGRGDLLGLGPVLGRGHVEKFRARVKNRKTRLPGARGTFGGEIRPPQKFLPEVAQLFCILRFGRADPDGREIAKTLVFWALSA